MSPDSHRKTPRRVYQYCPGGASRPLLSMSAAADALRAVGMTPSLIQMVKYPVACAAIDRIYLLPDSGHISFFTCIVNCAFTI